MTLTASILSWSTFSIATGTLSNIIVCFSYLLYFCICIKEQTTCGLEAGALACGTTLLNEFCGLLGIKYKQTLDSNIEYKQILESNIKYKKNLDLNIKYKEILDSNIEYK